jgi:ABC-2 type transport system permease protein
LRNTYIIFQRDVREILKTRAFLIICILVFLITIAAAVITSVLLGRREWIGEAAARPLLELIIGLLSYFMPLFVLMVFIWGFSGLQIVKEKVDGITTSLIATTITPRQLWIGKSLAIFIPGYLMTIVSTMAVILSINLSVILPASGSFVFPLPLFLVSLIWNPMLLLATLMFIILFSLAGNPDIAIAPSFIVGFGLMMGIPIGMVLGGINIVSWDFSLWYLAGTAVFWIIVIILTRFLTKENMVLSSKGS